MKRLLIVLLLAGCAQQQPKSNIYEASAKECELFGFERGSEAYGNCMQREVQSRREMGLRMIR